MTLDELIAALHKMSDEGLGDSDVYFKTPSSHGGEDFYVEGVVEEAGTVVIW